MIQPTFDRILVRKQEAPKTTPGGIALPDAAKPSRICRGKVLAVGDGCPVAPPDEKTFYRPLIIKQGDTIIFDEHVTHKVEEGGETLYLIREYDALAVVK